MNALELYRSVFKTASVSIGIISTKGKLLDINDNFREILGCRVEEISEINLPSKLITHESAMRRLASRL